MSAIATPIEVAADQAELALTLAERGRHAEAIAMLWDALPVLERELGAYHPDVIAALESLAAIHERRGEHEQARVLFDTVALRRVPS